MLNSKKVAITGGLASGKTTVARIFKELGAFVISADEIVHQLLSQKHSSNIQDKIVDLLGHEIKNNGILDRNRIARIVFKDEKLLKQLEQILHPEVLLMLQKAFLEHQDAPLFVAEIPLLFEASYEKWFDATVAVTSPESACINRFSANGGAKEEYFRRMQFQMSPKEKETKAQFTITNDSDLESLRSQVVQLFHVLTLGGVTFS